MGMTHLESRVGISLGRRAEQEREREAGSRETGERAPRRWWPGPEAARKPSRSRQCWARGAKGRRAEERSPMLAKDPRGRAALGAWPPIACCVLG